MLIKIDDEEAEDPGPMPQLEDMNPYLSALRAQLEAADKVEFEIEENQNHAKILSLLKEKQEMEIAASQRGL